MGVVLNSGMVHGYESLQCCYKEGNIILCQLCSSLPYFPNISRMVNGNWEGEEEAQDIVCECDCVQMQRSTEKKRKISLNSFEMEFCSAWDCSCPVSLLKPSCLWQDAFFSKQVFVSYASIPFLYYKWECNSGMLLQATQNLYRNLYWKLGQTFKNAS